MVMVGVSEGLFRNHFGVGGAASVFSVVEREETIALFVFTTEGTEARVRGSRKRL